MPNPRNDSLEVVWVTPGDLGLLANRARLGVLPAPGRRDWARNLSQDLAQLRAQGVSVLVTLLPDVELRELGIADIEARAAAAGMRSLRLPIGDYGVPELSAARKLLAEIVGHLGAEETVAIHCRAGYGRSGLMAASTLVTLGAEPAAAIAAVRRVRPGAVETGAQVDFVERVAAPASPGDAGG
jgi:protein-tyrosine phosphatase